MRSLFHDNRTSPAGEPARIFIIADPGAFAHTPIMPDDVPAELRTFISEHIGSLVQLELLLLLAAEPAKTWSAEEAAKVLYVNADAAFGLLEGMRARGLLEHLAEERFRFAPQKVEWAPLVASLAAFYKERRLTVSDLIYNSPVEKYQSFADAFRFRRRKEE